MGSKYLHGLVSPVWLPQIRGTFTVRKRRNIAILLNVVWTLLQNRVMCYATPLGMGGTLSPSNRQLLSRRRVVPVMFASPLSLLLSLLPCPGIIPLNNHCIYHGKIGLQYVQRYKILFCSRPLCRRESFCRRHRLAVVLAGFLPQPMMFSVH